MSGACLSSECSSYSSGPLGQVFTSSLQLLYTAQCLLHYDWPPDSSNNITDLVFDFIIVGAGTSGSVVASRLSEDKCRRVLLVEAGGDPPIESTIPPFAGTMEKTMYDWQYESEVDPISCKGSQGGRCHIAAGKMLGGGSSINRMFYVRGNRKDFDDIKSAGNTGWGYDEALKYFKKSENLSDSFIRNDPQLSQYHNYSGPIGVWKYRSTNFAEENIIKAYEELGYTYNQDYNGVTQSGVSRLQTSIKEGKRSGSAREYLLPARDRSNLILLKHALATKVVINNHKFATGVIIKLINGTEIEATAIKEVVLCAGTIRTPQLLMLSGIGPSVHLNKFNIPLVSDVPAGGNFIDHILCPILVKLDMELPVKTEAQIALNVAKYLAFQTGPYSYISTPGANIVSFVNVNSLNGSLDPPTFQIIHNILTGKQAAGFFTGRYSQMLGESVLSQYENNTMMIFYLALLETDSRGNVSLANTNPSDYPKIYANYLHDRRDVNKLMKGIEFVNRLVDTPSLKSIGAEVARMDIPECNAYTFLSNDYWHCILYQIGTSFTHPIGTSKMGPECDPEAVINTNLQVNGVSNLRVADASAIPNTIRGNTNSATLVFAERASDLIRSSHKTNACDC